MASILLFEDDRSTPNPILRVTGDCGAEGVRGLDIVGSFG
jgi:hypothetical protein